MHVDIRIVDLRVVLVEPKVALVWLFLHWALYFIFRVLGCWLCQAFFCCVWIYRNYCALFVNLAPLVSA